MRKPDFLLAAIAITLFLGAAGPAQQAHGGLLICASRKLTGSDQSAAFRAIKGTAGQRSVAWKTLSSCVNHASAYAWIDLEKEPQPDGSVLHPSLSCRRGFHFWKCENEVERYLDVTLHLDAQEGRLSVQLPEKWNVTDVQPLLESGFRQIPSLRTDQECGFEPGDAGSPKLLDHLKTVFTLDGEQKTFSITEQTGEVSLENFAEVLVFRRAPAQGSPFTFKCWQTLIVLA